MGACRDVTAFVVGVLVAVTIIGVLLHRLRTYPVPVAAPRRPLPLFRLPRLRQLPCPRRRPPSLFRRRSPIG